MVRGAGARVAAAEGAQRACRTGGLCHACRVNLPSGAIAHDREERRELRKHQVLRVAELLSWLSIAVGVLTLLGGMVARFL
jgi:hypothetical protein